MRDKGLRFESGLDGLYKNFFFSHFPSRVQQVPSPEALPCINDICLGSLEFPRTLLMYARNTETQRIYVVVSQNLSRTDFTMV